MVDCNIVAMKRRQRNFENPIAKRNVSQSQFRNTKNINKFTKLLFKIENGKLTEDNVKLNENGAYSLVICKKSLAAAALAL